MNVDASMLWPGQKLRRQDSSIGYYYGDIGVVRSEQILHFRGFDFLRLMNCQVVSQREFFDGWRMQLLPAARRLVRLRPDSGNFVTIIDEPPQRRHRRFRSAHKDDAH